MPVNELHITNWYPNRFQPHEAPFVCEHFRGLPEGGRRELWHVQVRSEGSLWLLHSGSTGKREQFLILDTPIRTWRVLERLHLSLLKRLRKRLGERWWDVVVVHIAYPLLRFPEAFKRLFGDKVVIVEHWSAFHTGFNLPENSPARARIQRIFQQGFPVVAVSEALLEDIRAFAGDADFPGHVVGNVVDTTLFHPPESPVENSAPVFLMVGNWAPIKRPFLVFEAFRELLIDVPQAQLRVIGYGAQWEAMAKWVDRQGLQDSIRLLGPMEKAQIAEEMRGADALLHASDYETFSVVCAEAIVCGTPAIASDVGGIREFIDQSNGLLVENDAVGWEGALKTFWKTRNLLDEVSIASSARKRFGNQEVGLDLEKVIQKSARALSA